MLKMNRKKIDASILEIQNLQLKYNTPDVIFIYQHLGKALDKIGWFYAECLAEEKDKEMAQNKGMTKAGVEI